METNALNYPDILGYISGGARLNLGVVQVALAARPRVVRAGQPFDAVLLIQNASDSEVDVAVTLQLPQTDAKKQPNRFVAKNARVVVGLSPAEVGYLVMHVALLPDTAVGMYKLSVKLDAKPTKKANRIRQPEGGGTVDLKYCSAEAVAQMDDLKKLTYSTTKAGTLTGGAIEVPFSVMSTQIGQLIDLKPGWVSLWSMKDYYRDERQLIERFGGTLATQVLPQLKRHKLLTALARGTELRLRSAGYNIQPIEAHFIAKLLAHTVETAPLPATNERALGDAQPHRTLVDMPLMGWSRALLLALDREPQVAEKPVQALASLLYGDLARDAARLGFKLVRESLEAELGSDADETEYIDRLIRLIGKPMSHPEFTDVYLPLVLGGVICCDQAALPGENLHVSLQQLETALHDRRGERSEENALVFELAQQAIDAASEKYTYNAVE